MRSKLTVAVVALAAITITACDEAPTATLAGGETPASGARGAAHNDAPFPVFHQGFNHGVFPWSDGEEAGPTGWCGDINHVDGREGADPQPSAGRGYATVAFGACNEYWTGVFSGVGLATFSGPASGPDPELLSTTWPASGFVQELDVHLDPADYAGGLAFIYTNSLCILATDTDPDLCDPDLPEPGDDPLPPSPYRYFPVFVVKGGPVSSSPLLVVTPDAAPLAAVTEPGWYTFRHVFGSEGGTLTVDFELRKDEQLLGSSPVLSTFITEESTSSFDVTDLGSGYIWFPVIAGPALPIDEQRLRRGR